MNEETLFIEAMEIRDAAEQAAYLDRVCAGDAALRVRLERLLDEHHRAGSFLGRPAVAPGATRTFDPSPEVETTALPGEHVGTQIGPYKLLQQIGEGGMGTVYMAEQTHPVKRKVALKVIKAGMDSRQVVARFEAERQALAMMDHVNIARVFDGGTTENGWPYFVMELVHGVPITKYCDDNHLSTRERLELFVPVCQAIQHAHQKGIIHRDIKPSNVMVTLYDGKPVPKVIDFGVAKATEQKLTDRTLFTQYGSMVGTLEYMSPEQAEMSALGVDTRSDIYSLGVLLYELLTGNTPLTHKRMKEGVYAEILRMIKEEEPPKPSTRLSDSGEALASISANRHTEPAQLTKLVRGELDWIVMKTLEKDRNRRYETANAFAADVLRYLNDETVQACPPSAVYRLRKFTRRNRGGLAVAALVLFFLVLLGSGVGWAVRDRSARNTEADRLRVEREAEAARQQAQRQGKVDGQVESVFAEVDRLEKEQKWSEALTAARRAAEAAVAGGEADPETTARVRRRLKDLEFIDRLEQIRMEDGNYEPDHAKRDLNYARAFRDYGVDVLELAVEESVQRLKAKPALAIPLAAALDEWIFLRRLVSISLRRVLSKDDAAGWGRLVGDTAGWKRLVAVAHGIDPEPLRDRLRSTPFPPDPATQDELRRLAESLDVRAHHPATLYRLAVTLRGDPGLRILRDAQIVNPGDFWLNYELGNQLSRGGYHTKRNLDGPIRFYTVALAVRPSAARRVYPELGHLLRERGDLDEAIAVYRQIGLWHEIAEILIAQGKPDEAIAAYRKCIEAGAFGHWSDIGGILRVQGKPDEAIAAYRQGVEAMPEDAGYLWRSIGDTLREQKKPDEAADAYRNAVAALRQTIEAMPEGADYRYTMDRIGDMLRAHGKPDEALAVYRQAIEGGSKATYEYWRTIGDTLIAQGKSDEAIAAYRKAIAESWRAIEAKPERERDRAGSEVDLAHSIGGGLRVQGKPNEAVAVYRVGIEERPAAADKYLHSIGDILRDQKKPAEAADAYRNAGELKPNVPAHHHSLGLALRNLNKPAEANTAFDKAIELFRKAPDLNSAGRYYNIGVVLRDQGKLEEAIDAFRKAIDIDPKYTSAIQDLVNALRARGRLGEVIDVYRKAVKAAPNDFAHQENLGAALVQQEKLDEAIAEYRKAIDVAPTPNRAAGAYLSIGNVLYRQKKMTEAIAAYHRVIELDPSDKLAPAGYFGLGNILRDWGKLDEAGAAYRTVIAFNRPDATLAAYVCLGEVLFQQNKLDEAIGVYRKIIELKSDSPRTHSKLAWILATRPEANLRDPKQALALAGRATELAPNSEHAWQYLGWIHYRTGNWKSSIEALEKSCKLQKGGAGDSGQWIVLALAHAKLAVQEGLTDKEREHHKAEARRWFDQADKQIDSRGRVRPSDELAQATWDFRAEARALMGLKESKK